MRRKYNCLILILLLVPVHSAAQQMQSFGLEGTSVTALAFYGGALYAGTDGNGVFTRELSHSTWADFGLQGIQIRSIYPHEIGPVGWGITVGAEPSGVDADTALIYCWSSYEPRWAVADSGLDRDLVSSIYALDGFPDPRI